MDARNFGTMEGMMDFLKLNEMIAPENREAADAAVFRLNDIAKPVGSLGELESIVVRLAALTGSADIDIAKKAVLVLSADNGVLKQGVAQTPGEITAVMTDFIADKRSSVCIMAKCAGAETFSVDMGMFTKIANPNVIDRRIADGTADMTQGPAMSREQAEQAINTGMELVKELKDKGFNLIATGEMGIGNTTTSSAVASALLKKDIDEMTGRGAGLSDEGLTRKVNAIKKAFEVNKPDSDDALDVLHKLGGFDIAGMCGIFLGGAVYRVPILADGFISAVSALVAKRLCPKCVCAMFASHMSAEPAAKYVIDELGIKPVIHAGMRLGEGTGAAAMMPLMDMAVAVYNDLMTYADIGM